MVERYKVTLQADERAALEAQGFASVSQGH